MNATERMQAVNARKICVVNAAIKQLAARLRPTSYRLAKPAMLQTENTFTPRAILAWFFTWTLCVTGFVLAMTVLTTLAKLAKMFLP